MDSQLPRGDTDNAVIAKTGTIAASIDTGCGMSIASKANGDTAITTGGKSPDSHEGEVNG